MKTLAIDFNIPLSMFLEIAVNRSIKKKSRVLLSSDLLNKNSSQSTDDCRNVEITPPISDSALVGHVINETEVGFLGTCRVMCYIEADCVSLNVVPLQHAESLLCELSDSDHIQHPEDLFYRPGSTYVSIKVSA